MIDLGAQRSITNIPYITGPEQVQQNIIKYTEMRDNVIERSLIPHHLGHDMQLYGSPVPQSFFGSIKPHLSALYFLFPSENLTF